MRLDPEQAKIYEIVPYDPRKGYPGRIGLSYRCPLCGEIIPSSPPTSMTCGCGNLYIETGVLRVKNPDLQPMLLKKRTIFSKMFGPKK